MKISNEKMAVVRDVIFVILALLVLFSGKIGDSKWVQILVIVTCLASVATSIDYFLHRR